MFFHFKSDSLSKLAQTLAQKSYERKGGNPFEKQWIVVQNKEMQQWLTLQIAEFEGIAANLEFVLPSELMWKLYRLGIKDVPKSLPSDRIPMQLQIFDILQSIDQVSSSLKLPNGLSNSTKSHFQFSGQVADVFDLYQVYRPNLLNEWENGNFTTGDKTEFWQSRLWNLLVSNWRNSFPDIPTRKDAFFELIKALETDQSKTSEFPEQIFVFGLSSFSAPFSSLLISLAKILEVYFFDHNPSKLENFGLSEEEWRSIQSDWIAPKSQNLDLLTNKITNSGISYNKESYDSGSIGKATIGIHSCHNSRREVEVLKDELLKEFESQKDIKPNDVLILVPDMEVYASIIKSVFSLETDGSEIPVFIRTQNPGSIETAFEKLLQTLSVNLKASSFYELLELEAFKNRFELNESDLKQIKAWLQKNRVHWGISLQDSKNSIEKGLISIFGGFAMELNSFESYKTFIPFEGISNSDQLELSSKLSEVVSFLNRCIVDFSASKTIKEWLEVLRNWYDELTFERAQTDISSYKMGRSLGSLIDSARISGSEVKIDFDLFSTWVLTHIIDSKASSSGFGKGVVLSTYIPYRNIPFKFTALLGFNEQEFPRNPVRPGFDIIHNYPEKGDRITKEDDQLLFLETVNTTSNRLHVSYLGQDQHTENEKLPSVLLQRLMDKLESGIFTKHRLHGFNTEYFATARSFSKRRKELAEIVFHRQHDQRLFYPGTEVIIEKEKPVEIRIDELISFFTNPCKYFSINELGIKDRFEENELEDREAFKVSGLTKFLLDHIISDGLNEGISQPRLKEYVQNSNLLPSGISGERAFYDEYKEVVSISEIEKNFQKDKESESNIDFELDGLRLVGKIADVFGSHRIRKRLGKFRAVDFISLWINHLVLMESSKDFQESIQICKDNTGKVSVTTISGVVDSSNILRNLLKWFLGSTTNKGLLAFFPESSRVYYETLAAKKDKSVSIEKALNNWVGSEYSFISEGSDYYNQLVWRDEEPVLQKSFDENAALFWKPILEFSKTELL